MIAAIFAYMLIFTFVGSPHKSAIVTVKSNQSTNYVRCSYEYGQFHIALFISEAIALVMGIKLCWAIKGVPDAVDESKFVALGKHFRIYAF